MEKNLRVLVVEDDAIIGMDIEHRVKKLGYEVCGVADTAAEALEIASSKKPDIALMDIRLRGEVDGIEAARMLRDQLSVPVIFITAYSDMKMRSRALDIDPLGYIVKPLREVELRKTLEAAEEKVRAG
ncbi:response regulator [Methanogenium organophilum]|uniref:Response regulator n=1 Tax=Methanogenium organophilum TaxID=2199 RepID=A0A9X9S6S6_METOG|nr:response regulator [Methanogenium organophilum]WAI02443.1 response regulator [Methanogenium organophilum]